MNSIVGGHTTLQIPILRLTTHTKTGSTSFHIDRRATKRCRKNSSFLPLKTARPLIDPVGAGTYALLQRLERKIVTVQIASEAYPGPGLHFLSWSETTDGEYHPATTD